MNNWTIIKNKSTFPPRFVLSLLFLFLFSNFLVAQQTTLKGNVKDENNNPLQSVSVTVKGKPNLGVTTDVNGNFSISASVNDILVFEFVGYQKQEIKAGDNPNLNVTLSLLGTKLDEVVVIGYGTKLKGELTGAVSKVDSKTFQDRPLTNATNALQGALPGVTVTRNNGKPGREGYSIDVRGASSLIELALEGFRYDDLRRWKTAETELPKAVMGIKIIGTPWVNPIVVEGEDRNPYKDEYWKNRTDANGFIITEKASDRSFAPDKHYLLPIPTKEILINPELEQNPGW